jgi:hypothetical protein
MCVWSALRCTVCYDERASAEAHIIARNSGVMYSACRRELR